MFKDKVVVITGGVQGIGKCCTERFARERATVHMIDIKDGPQACRMGNGRNELKR